MTKKNMWNRFLVEPISKEVSKNLASTIFKQLAIQNEKLKVKEDGETFQWEYPYTFNLPTANRIKQKPEGSLSWDALRNFSVHYPVARACIDYLKTKILKLEWEIMPENEEQEYDPNSGRILATKEFFKHPTGERSSYRNFLDAVVEDYLVLGVWAAERMTTRGGQFLGKFNLVDAATIRVIVDEYGRLPEPPEIAYVQYIRGEKTAEMTQDDLLYVNRGNRTNTVYGLSPIESIIIQVETALKSSIYNLKWYDDGNVPEGFGELPEDWPAKQIREFQTYFDAMIAGNPKYQRRIKMVPKGFNYTATKKPSDLAFKELENWLLQQTCAVFGVPPQDLGFTNDINRATADVQRELGQERGMKPIAQMLEEVFTNVVQNDLGFKDLAFRYVNVDPIDKEQEANIDDKRVKAGIVSVDEIRTRDGLKPIGLGHYISNGQSVVLAEQLGMEKPDTQKEEKEVEDDEDLQRQDIILWRKQSLNAFKRGKSFKKFESPYLDKWMIDEIYGQLKKVTDKKYIHKVFEPYLTNKMQVVKQLNELVTNLSQ